MSYGEHMGKTKDEDYKEHVANARELLQRALLNLDNPSDEINHSLKRAVKNAHSCTDAALENLKYARSLETQ